VRIEVNLRLQDKLVDKQNYSSMNPQDLRVLFGLMAHSDKSDRAMAKILGMSNTSLSKKRRKLEKEGYIREYTLIPDLSRLGLKVVVFHFSSSPEVYTSAELEHAYAFNMKYPEVVCLLNERSHAGTNWFAISVHKSYDDYIKLTEEWREKILAMDPKWSVLASHNKRHDFVYHTDQSSPIPFPFSFRKLELIVQSTKTIESPKTRKRE
jgi:DNA-binding Lrp family transcriptional regulator